MSLHTKTASELAALLAAGQTTARAIAQAYIERTQSVDTRVKAFTSFDTEDLLKQADASDARRQTGKTLGPLDGIPVGIKDILAVKDQPLTCSSKILSNFIAPYDATAIRFLKEQGALLWGRLNMDEFAMGSSTENSSVQTTANPWDLERIPGGSSGGSAACVAAREAPLSLGTDTGGSIRQPASLCGVVGLKPTYGLVSRYGLVAFASSLDQIGPFAQTVEDAALLLQAIAGHDQLDSTSYKSEIPNYLDALNTHKGPWKLGLPSEFFGDGVDPEIREAVEKAIAFYKTQGHEIIDITLPHTELAVPVYYIIAPAEASSNLARYDGVRYTKRSDNAKDAIDLYFKSRAEGFGAEVKRRILIGCYVLSSGYYDAYYVRAQKVRTLIRNDFMNAYAKQGVDAIITPTTPTPAFKIGEKSADPLAMYLSDVFTISANLAGLPALSVPCGFTKNKLPIGMQLIGQPFQEAQLLSIANAYDKAHLFGKEAPELG